MAYTREKGKKESHTHCVPLLTFALGQVPGAPSPPPARGDGPNQHSRDEWIRDSAGQSAHLPQPFLDFTSVAKSEDACSSLR